MGERYPILQEDGGFVSVQLAVRAAQCRRRSVRKKRSIVGSVGAEARDWRGSAGAVPVPAQRRF